MTAEDRARWDKIYRSTARDPYPPPDPLLYEYTPKIHVDEGRRALDLACGMGQNGLWLASQGYIVDLMDISRVALSRARAEMASRNLRNANLLQIDVDALQLDPDTYDLVCVFRYLKRDLMSVLAAAVKRGGRLIYDSYNLNYLETVPEFNRDFLLRPGELANTFPDWQVLYADEVGHHSQFVAVKPAVTSAEGSGQSVSGWDKW